MTLKTSFDGIIAALLLYWYEIIRSNRIFLWRELQNISESDVSEADL